MTLVAPKNVVSVFCTSLQTVQEDKSHSTGFLELKSTMVRRGDGNLAEMCWTDSLSADRLPSKSLILLLVDSSPLASFK